MRIKEAHLTTSSALESKVTVKAKKQKITLDDGWRLAINALRQKRLRSNKLVFINFVKYR